MKCTQCGETLNKHEELEILEAQVAGFQTKILCDDCFQYLEDQETDFSDFSDADPGL